jgi:hypothetical protein
MAFWNPWTIGALLGAGKSLLTGEDLIKGAAVGGVAGGIGSQFAGSDAVSGVGSAPSGVSGVGAAPGVGSSVVPGSIESSGMVTGASGNLVNPEYFVGEGTPFQTFTGGQGLLSNLGDEASSALSNIAPENLTGLATLLNQPDTSQYRQMAGTGGGGVSRGQLGQSQPLSNVAVNRRKMNIWA